MRGVETKWRRLGDVARSTETVSRGLEVNLQTWRLGGPFCGAHDASAPPPSLHKYLYFISKNCFKFFKYQFFFSLQGVYFFKQYYDCFCVCTIQFTFMTQNFQIQKNISILSKVEMVCSVFFLKLIIMTNILYPQNQFQASYSGRR